MTRIREGQTQQSPRRIPDLTHTIVQGMSPTYGQRMYEGSPVPRHALLKLHPVAAETVQRAPDRQVYLALAELLHHVQVPQVPAAARVRDRQAAPLGQPLHKLLVDPFLQALVVRRVDEELGAIGLQQLDGLSLVERTLIDLHVRDGLPLVHGHEPPVVPAPPAAEVDDELIPVAAQRLEHRVQPLLAEPPVREQVRRDDDLLRPGLDPLPRVLVVDASPDLQPARPRLERFPGRLRVAGAQHDDMGPGEAVVPVQPRKVSRRVCRDEVGLELRRRAVERAADNLLHLPGVQVYARAEPRHLSVGD
ncbi:hypothetical protein CSUB01_05778 [Colletotrichum sublineola]|uniref:Uncharacterized protein n=1 Tax=Colletotrichum sublineola TaxID=1173701 RepID=A0A066X8A0_COLSU|nr:hypothetical protein CSUB01_05778 [Colletotrichum sublineola]